QSELDDRAVAELGLDGGATAQVLDVAAYDVHADAAARNVGHGVRGGEARQKDQVADLVVGHHRVRIDQAFFTRLLKHLFGVDAAAVVANLDDDTAAALVGRHPDRALLALALGDAVGRGFDAVIDR